MVKSKKLSVATSGARQLLDITGIVEKALRETGVRNGICHVFVAGATAGVVLNESHDPAIEQDILDLLDRVIPEGQWRHDRIDDNGAAHLKSAWVGASETVPVRNGELLLGTWQNIFLCEFDGPRAARPVWVTVLGE